MESLEGKIAALRLVKDQDEIARLRRAITITTTPWTRPWARSGRKCGSTSSKRPSSTGSAAMEPSGSGFPSIIGSGPNGVTLHYDKNRRQIQPGDLVVQDVGAEFGYYTADVTRTIPVSGRFTSGNGQSTTLCSRPSRPPLTRCDPVSTSRR